MKKYNRHHFFYKKMKRFVKSAIKIYRNTRYMLESRSAIFKHQDTELLGANLVDLYEKIIIIENLPRNVNLHLNMYAQAKVVRTEAAEVCNDIWFYFNEKMSTVNRRILLVYSAIDLVIKTMDRLYPDVEQLEENTQEFEEMTKDAYKVEADHMSKDMAECEDDDPGYCGI